MIKAASVAVIHLDAVKASDELVAGLISPNPPSLAGRREAHVLLVNILYIQ